MKKTYKYILMMILVLGSLVGLVQTRAVTSEVVYFKEATCIVCQEVTGTIQGVYHEDLDYIKKMEDAGITVYIIDILPRAEVPSSLPSNIVFDNTEPYSTNDIFSAFTAVYQIHTQDADVPIVFAGDKAYIGIEAIKEAFDNGELSTKSQESLLEVNVTAGQAYEKLKSVLGFISILAAGLLDGFNPCAIALLLLFISLLGFTEKKRVLILVSITYIFALFISYFLIGTILLEVLNTYVKEITIVNTILSWIIFLIVSFLFLFNMYDYVMSKNKNYEKIKNQLPKWIQRMNKKIMKTFTNVINDDENNKGLLAVIALTFVLGVTLSITELVCTGQIYFGILDGISYYKEIYAYIALFFYNIMFVVPLIIIAVISIRGQGVMATSNWVREHMHVIKLLNSLLFLGIALYYVYRIFIVGLS